MGRISMFFGMENYVFSMYISILQSNNRFLETYSVFSYSVFFAVVTILCIYNIKLLLTIYNHRKGNYREKN